MAMVTAGCLWWEWLRNHFPVSSRNLAGRLRLKDALRPVRHRLGYPQECLMTDKTTPAQVVAARLGSGLTTAQASALLGVTQRTWQRWEAGDRTMPSYALDAFKSKIGG